MNQTGASRLERSCGPGDDDWVRIAPSRPGFERIEAFFASHGFDPHRHDTYAMGLTLRGVQSFRYKGTPQNCLPGQVFVLHPDEIHDGHAGSVSGFRYKILYIDPRLIQEALGEPYRALPHLRDAVSNDACLAATIETALEDLDMPLDELRFDEIVLNIGEVLAAIDGSVPRRAITAIHRRAVENARDFLDTCVQRETTSVELEAITGLSHFSLARHFRRFLGTSPYRYLILRRLDRVRSLISAGMPLAKVAISSGFADQSHMTRHFKKAYGMTPGRWAAIAARHPEAMVDRTGATGRGRA
jgi:AraC-like DNA-binding protein